MTRDTSIRSTGVIQEENEEEDMRDLEEQEEEEDNEEQEQEEFEFQEKIMFPSPKVSRDEGDIPIVVQSKSFEERILEASPDAAVQLELSPCDNCGRKFNPTALERHMKVCEKGKSKPRKIFDAINKIWKNEAEVEKENNSHRPLSIKKKKPVRPEDEYQMCDFCRRRFCPNAFDRHVEFCREKSTRLQTSPSKDIIAQAKLLVRTKYKPPAPGSKGEATSPSRRTSLASLFSEVSLPPWNLGSGRNTPAYSSLTRAEGNMRESARRAAAGGLLHQGTQSLGRAAGRRFIRQGDASASPPDEDWQPDKNPKAPTLSRQASGRGSIKKPALTKAALLRLSAGEKKADEEEKKRKQNEFGAKTDYENNNSLEYFRNRSRTPGNSINNNNLMSRSAHEYYRSDRGRTETPQLVRRSSSRSRAGRDSLSPYSWQTFTPLMKPSPYILPLTRAEPDGIENDEDEKSQQRVEGGYDHSKEYDPFQTAERQMQELLFGTSQPSSSASSAYSLQKPKPVRPSATSAFSVYSSGKPGRSSPGKMAREYSLSPNKFTKDYFATTTPTRQSARDFMTNKGASPARDYVSPTSPAKFSPPKDYQRPYGLSRMASSDYGGLGKNKPGYLSIGKSEFPSTGKYEYGGIGRNDYSGIGKNSNDYMSLGKNDHASMGKSSSDYTSFPRSDYASVGKSSDYSSMEKSGDYSSLGKSGDYAKNDHLRLDEGRKTDYSGLTRQHSLRSSRNWADMFPSLSRTPSGATNSTAAAAAAILPAIPSAAATQPSSSSAVANSSATSATTFGTSVARFCHECGNAFPLPSIRFCCECGVKRLYC